jgi:hypothetical protein
VALRNGCGKVAPAPLIKTEFAGLLLGCERKTYAATAPIKIAIATIAIRYVVFIFFFLIFSY